MRNKLYKIITFVICIYTTNIIYAQVATESPSAVSFYFDPNPTKNNPGMWKIEHYSWGSQKLAAGYSKALQDEFEGNFVHFVGKTDRFEGASTQWLSFSVSSTNFFRTNGHLAMIGHAETSAYMNRGRGFIMGRNSRFDDSEACSDSGIGTAWTQPEIWWTDAAELNPSKMQRNWVGGGELCGQISLVDGLTYDVTIHLSDKSTTYWITAHGSKLPIITTSFQNLEPKESVILNSRTGYTFGVAFGRSNFPWHIDITNITSGWF